MIPPYVLRVPKGLVPAFGNGLAAAARVATYDRRPGRGPGWELSAIFNRAAANYTLLIAAVTHLEVEIPRELLDHLWESWPRVRDLAAGSLVDGTSDLPSWNSLMDHLRSEVDEQRRKTLIDFIGEIR